KVLSRRGTAKVIHLLGTYSTSYAINLGDHNVTRYVTFLSEETNPPLADFTNTSLTTGIRQLNVSGLKLSGTIHIDAQGQQFRLNLTRVQATSGRTVVNVTDCRQLTVLVDKSDFIDSMLAFSSVGTTSATFVQSTFRGTTPRNATSAGIAVAFPKRGGKHLVRLHRCLFENLQQAFDSDVPTAAFSLLAAKEKTKVKLFVADSSFRNNSRAIDLSLRGDVFVSVTGSDFIGNVADGSGGAVRATATLSKGFGSLAVLERAVVNVLNCTFTENNAVTSELFDENNVYFQCRRRLIASGSSPSATRTSPATGRPCAAGPSSSTPTSAR
ncbi:hypothetical protein NP493_251g03015, partial [Ridgeia piscesae]